MEKELKTVIRENTWMSRAFMDCGWGNGYVVIPKGHPLHGMHYDAINEYEEISVNGGLTFSEPASELNLKEWGLKKSDKESWVVGFDTAHYRDTLKKWPKEAVQKEADELLKQLNLIKI